MDKENPLIKIESVEDNTYYQICISDNEPGIAREMQSKIFEIFKTVHHDVTKDSHGVGLSIVKQLVEQHQGRIWVESEPGKETTFYLLFLNDDFLILASSPINGNTIIEYL